MKFCFIHIENSERFVLYCLCGCLAGICIILLTIIIILYIEKRFRVKDDYESPQTDILYDEAPSYLPVYRFNCRTHHDFHHI
jgi:hypothetical protein